MALYQFKGYYMISEIRTVEAANRKEAIKKALEGEWEDAYPDSIEYDELDRIEENSVKLAGE